MSTATDFGKRERVWSRRPGGWFLATVWGVGIATAGASAETFNIEIDYMIQVGPGGHSHRPTPSEIAAVVQMFACQGHTLNVVVDDAIAHIGTLRCDDLADDFFSCDDPNSFATIKEASFDNDGEGWHYCVFGHDYDNGSGIGSSGTAEIDGDDFLVSLGSFNGQTGTAWDRAATLAHEFGHNLGLTHCGDMGGDTGCGAVGRFLPNVPSVMSYFYQLTGVRTNLLCHGLAFPEAAFFKELDYSHGRMCVFNEAALDESFGTGMIGVDWDCDGSTEGVVAQDLNGDSGGWCAATGGLNVLWDSNEWARISDSARGRSADELSGLQTITCITAEEWAQVQMKRDHCAQPAVTQEPCISVNMMIYLKPTLVWPWMAGSCGFPYDDLVTAESAAAPGSALFLAPGTYSEHDAPLVLSKQMTLFSTGQAVITAR